MLCQWFGNADSCFTCLFKKLLLIVPVSAYFGIIQIMNQSVSGVRRVLAVISICVTVHALWVTLNCLLELNSMAVYPDLLKSVYIVFVNLLVFIGFLFAASVGF